MRMTEIKQYMIDEGYKRESAMGILEGHEDMDFIYDEMKREQKLIVKIIRMIKEHCEAGI